MIPSADGNQPLSPTLGALRRFPPSPATSLSRMIADTDRSCVPSPTSEKSTGYRRVMRAVASRSAIDVPLKKGPWTKEDDTFLKESFRAVVGGDIEHSALPARIPWSRIALHVPGKSGKQCREHWQSMLDPKVKRGPWSKKEKEVLFKMVDVFGFKWVFIANHLPGRTQNQAKNHWYSAQRQKSKNTKTRDRGETLKKNGDWRSSVSETEEPDVDCGVDPLSWQAALGFVETTPEERLKTLLPVTFRVRHNSFVRMVIP